MKYPKSAFQVEIVKRSFANPKDFQAFMDQYREAKLSNGGRRVTITKEQERDLKTFFAKKTTIQELVKKWEKNRQYVAARIAFYAENY